MRYFIAFWVLLSTFFIFSDTLQAADVVEKVETQSIATPIEPIEPKANTNKANFWQKLGKNKAGRTQIEPIESSWYTIMGIYVILGTIILFLFGLYFIALRIQIVVLILFLSFGVLLIILLLVVALKIIFGIIYAIKLFATAKNEEGILEGKRFGLGYTVGILWLLFWLFIIILGASAATSFIGLIFVAVPLIFNIIDQKRYKKYLKEQNKAQ
jgi:hypothetical protein